MSFEDTSLDAYAGAEQISKTETPSDKKSQEKPREATAPGFKIRKSDCGLLSLWRKDDEKEDGWREVSGGIWVIGQARDTESCGWSNVVKYFDKDKKSRQWLMPLSLLAGEKTELLRQILDRGLFVVNSARAKNDLIDYLGRDTEGRFTTVERTGWHEDAFVLPDGVIGAGDYLLAGGKPSDPPKGTLDDWRDNLSKRCIGNSRLVFALSTAFASPLLYLTGIENGGVHFVGDTSLGKSKAAKCARSVFGHGLQSWRATDNGLEGVAARHNDIGLCLDDIGQVDARLAGEVSYMLGNGMGKIRSQRDGTDRKPQTWRLLYLSTGEVSLSDHMSSAGKKAKAGQEVRLINIEADAGAGLGLFERLNGAEKPEEFADSLDAATNDYYGTAGPAFIQYVVDNQKDSLDEINRYREQFLELAKLGKEKGGQVQRVANRFALIAAAGELATAAGITGWDIQEAVCSAETCFQSWRRSWAPTGNREAEQAIDHVRGFLQRHESRFQPTTDHYIPPNRAGFRTANEFWIDTEVFKNEVCEGLRLKAVTNALVAAGYLEVEANGNRSARRTREGLTQRYRVVNRSIFGSESDES